ncbi:MAG TPA: NAD-dependent epimerase/dehydratase family protein [Thermoanaerobaculia bacterium]|nr:NAD-dependent epimerase/dehydratase family protein [Thermoanaerobaculia bacterium]
MSLASIEGALAGCTVLVTGATGFIGGRLAERLVLEQGAHVRALVRNVAAASRLVRFPVTVIRGDVTNPADLAAAAEGCDLVFHCAYGTSGSQKHRAWVNKEGTRRLLEAARNAKASRAIFLSTLMVYGQTGDGDLDETAPRRRFGNPYSDSKLEAERIALDFSRSGRLPVAVIQPTAVYGPWGGVWTETVLRSLKAGRQILIDGGEGMANPVYVDDLVSAMFLAAVKDQAVGEAFLVCGEEAITWREMFGRFERMLGSERRTVDMTEAEALTYWHQWQRRRPRAVGEGLRILKGEREIRERIQNTREVLWLRELASAVLPESWQQKIKARISGGGRPPALPSRDLPIHPLAPKMIGFFRARTRVRIAKAKRLLGYQPAFDFATGMDLTERWARWANLL